MCGRHLTFVAVGLLLVACSEEPMTPLSSSGGGSAPASPHIGGGGSGGDGGAAPETLGTLDIVDIADGDCAIAAGEPTDLFAGEPYPPIAQRIARADGHYLAYGGDVDGLMWFDDGGDPAVRVPAGTVVAAAAQGKRVWAALADEALVLQRFKSNGATAGPPRVIADGVPAAAAIAARDDGALVAWAEEGRILARALVDGKLYAPVAVAEQAWTTFVRIAVAEGADGTAIVWTGDASPGQMHTAFALVGAHAVLQPAAELLRTSNHHELVDLEPTATGFAMLLTGGLPERHPYLWMLDHAGVAAGPAARLLGAYFGWDLASRGHEIGVVSSRHSGEPQLRVFDTAATPMGPSICLALRGDIDLPVALAAEPEGFASLYFEPASPPEGRALFRRIAREEEP